MSPRYLPWLLLSVLVIIADQVTKMMALHYLQPYSPVPVMPFFNVMLAFNTGAAFSFLADAGGWQRWIFVGLAAVISSGLLIWLLKLPEKLRLLPMAITLIIGGAIGNVIDRIRYGHVVDFIDWYVGSYHWPAFNIADSAIFLGAALIILDGFLQGRRERAQLAAAGRQA